MDCGAVVLHVPSGKKLLNWRNNWRNSNDATIMTNYLELDCIIHNAPAVELSPPGTNELNLNFRILLIRPLGYSSQTARFKLKWWQIGIKSHANEVTSCEYDHVMCNTFIPTQLRTNYTQIISDLQFLKQQNGHFPSFHLSINLKAFLHFGLSNRQLKI